MRPATELHHEHTLRMQQRSHLQAHTRFIKWLEGGYAPLVLDAWLDGL